MSSISQHSKTSRTGYFVRNYFSYQTPATGSLLVNEQGELDEMMEIEEEGVLPEQDDELDIQLFPSNEKIEILFGDLERIDLSQKHFHMTNTLSKLETISKYRELYFNSIKKSKFEYALELQKLKKKYSFPARIRFYSKVSFVFFSLSYLANFFSKITIVAEPWCLLGLIISLGFYLMAIIVKKDFKLIGE